jgi:hypothetical protein
MRLTSGAFVRSERVLVFDGWRVAKGVLLTDTQGPAHWPRFQLVLDPRIQSLGSLRGFGANTKGGLRRIAETHRG